MALPRPGAGRTALMILSAPGAGAATVARVLQAAGAAPPADSAAVAALNDRALAAVGSGRDDPFGPRRRGEAPSPPPALAAEAQALARTAEPHEPLLLLADPAQTRLAAFWTAALEQQGWRVAFLVLVRAPAEAAAALSAEAGVARNRGLLLWASSMLEAERAARDGRRVVLAYDRLVADPEAELDRVERGLALRLPRRSWDSAAEIGTLLREAHRPIAAAALPQALAPLGAFADHLSAAAVDEPGNADVPAETERWFEALSDLAAPAARRAAREDDDRPTPGAKPAVDNAAAEALRRQAADAMSRAETAEAQAVILQSALAVARRRFAEAETLLQARTTQASAGEREARSALAAAVGSREAAEAERDRAHDRLAELDARLTEADARIDTAVAALHASDAARSAEAAQAAELGAELDGERGRHAEARERLALVGIANHAAQTRVRELATKIREMEEADRRRWLSRLLGRR